MSSNRSTLEFDLTQHPIIVNIIQSDCLWRITQLRDYSNYLEAGKLLEELVGRLKLFDIINQYQSTGHVVDSVRHIDGPLPEV